MRKIVYYLVFIIVISLCHRHVGAFSIDAPGRTTMTFKTIVIDPGHGGIDSGATGPSGTVEKEINLAIAKRLFELLSKRSGMNVVLTRSDDIYFPF
jgi:N-acetylmuramoyl-L-alanine amidase